MVFLEITLIFGATFLKKIFEEPEIVDIFALWIPHHNTHNIGRKLTNKE